VERRVDQGHVLLWTSTIDADWTDLPLRAPFVPLMQRAVMYLARRATSRAKDQVEVGKPLRIEVSSTVRERVIFQGPLHLDEASRQVVEPVEGVVTFVPTSPGCYVPWADQDDASAPLGAEERPRNRLDELAFCANPPASESMIEPLPESALDPWRGQGAKGEGGYEGPQRRKNVWPSLLFVVTLLLLAETMLGLRRSMIQRLLGSKSR
jgi:hypothetical protein